VRYIAINSYWDTLSFELPPLPDSTSRWIRVIDTSLNSPDDIADVERGSRVMGATYIVNPHSIVMLHFASAEEHPQSSFKQASATDQTMPSQ
jgi:glycogen operon protein